MYDLAVIGLGPAGIEAVKCALANGLSVVAFDGNKLGGTCLNVGCIPTKSILHSAVCNNLAKTFDKIGLKGESSYEVDWQKIIEREKSIVQKFSSALDKYVNNTENLKYVNSFAEITIDNDNILIEADYNAYEAKNIIIATGSRPYELENMPFDGKFILSSDDIFNLEYLPKSVAIVGSGAIGCEWAYIFSSFGVDVSLIEKASSVLPNMDSDIQKLAERTLKANNVHIYKDDFVKDYSLNKLVLNSGKEISPDVVLSCVGRKPVMPDIHYQGYGGAFTLKAQLNSCTTDFENVFIAGDASSNTMLAHYASYQARNAVNIILGKDEEFYPVPSVVYLSPEIASVGIREQDIDESYSVKKISLTSSQKAWCDNSTGGMLKFITKDNLVKGAHIVSPEASSLVMVLSFIIQNNIPTNVAKRMIYPHPTYSEIIQEAL